MAPLATPDPCFAPPLAPISAMSSSQHHYCSAPPAAPLWLQAFVSLVQISLRKLKMSRRPTVKWAQRPNELFITIELPDAKDLKLKLEPEGKFHFSANTPYEVDMDLFDKVNVNESKVSVGLRNNIHYLIKKAESEWWSRLLKQSGKPPVFLKVDRH